MGGAPRKSSQRRLVGFLKYFEDKATPLSLRIASLALQLSMLATNLSGQKSGSSHKRTNKSTT